MGRKMIDLTPQSSEAGDMPEPHTPTPWSEFAESGDWWIQQCDADGSPVGETVVSNANDMSAADMLFIVRACNAHDALVSTLKAVEAHHVEQNRIKGRDEANSTTLRLIRAALAKAWSR